MYTRIVSFDPAIRNFAIVIEDVNLKKLGRLREKYEDLPKKLQRKYRGKTNEKVTEILEKMYLNGNVIYSDLVDLGDSSVTMKVRRKWVKYLDGLKDWLLSADEFVIEQQFFGKVKGQAFANVDAIKMAEITLGWLFCNGVKADRVTMIMTSAKTSVLGAPEKLTKPQRKKWAVAKAKSILESRGDDETLETFNSFKKKDDVSDALIQAQAYKYLKYVARCLQPEESKREE